jgi:diguanylate cyclase (GGDEF)-like protein/PAS domain S-box-containing protein
MPLPSIHQIIEHFQDSVYVIDPDTSRILWCNQAGFASLGYQQDEIINHSVLSLQKDMAGLPQWDEIAQVIHNSPDGYTFVGRHQHKNGDETAVEVVTTVLTENNQTYFLSVARDITRRMAYEQSLHTREDSVWFAINEASDGIWEWELDTDYVFFSPQLKKMLGYGPDEMAPHVDTWVRNVHPEDIDYVWNVLDNHLKGHRSRYEAQYRLRNRNGHYLWVHDRGKVSLRDDNGQPVRVVGMVHDITDHKTMQAQLEQLAHYDILTGVANRREGSRQVQAQLQAAKFSQTGACLLVVDFDNFKRINDLHGHQTGDDVLKRGAQLLTDGLKQADCIYRWGGEEFVILLNGVSESVAEKRAETLHQRFAETDWQEYGIDTLTLSIGISILGPHGYKLDELIKHADNAAYQAKEKGRNLTVIAPLPSNKDDPTQNR